MPEAVDSASGMIGFRAGSFCLAALGGTREASLSFGVTLVLGSYSILRSILLFVLYARNDLLQLYYKLVCIEV